MSTNLAVTLTAIFEAVLTSAWQVWRKPDARSANFAIDRASFERSLSIPPAKMTPPHSRLWLIAHLENNRGSRGSTALRRPSNGQGQAGGRDVCPCILRAGSH